MAEPGTYVEVDGRPAVRFVRRYSQPVARVWDAVTAPEDLALWFPSPRVAYAEEEGAEIRFEGDPYMPHAVGTVLTWEPERLFAFSWGEDQLRLEVAPDGEDSVLTLTDLLGNADEAARNAAGWELSLAALDRALVDATEAAAAALASSGESETEWRRAYRFYLEAGFPTGAFVPEL